MTKREELKAALVVAWNAYYAAWDAYQEELKKTREDLKKGEGNAV